jgi:hypothetical protein
MLHRSCSTFTRLKKSIAGRPPATAQDAKLIPFIVAK